MKPNVDDWTVVVTGGWNAQIFSPEWVGENLFSEKEFEIQLILQGGNVFSSLKTSDIVFSATNSQIVCGMRSISEDTLVKAEDLVTKALDMLPYTPVNGVGVNFGFTEENPLDNLLDLFNFNDLAELSNFNCSIRENQIYRRIEIDGRILNLRQTLSADPSKAMAIHLNFHKDVLNTKEAFNWLKGEVLSFKKIAYRFLGEIYNVSIEQEENLEDENAA